MTPTTIKGVYDYFKRPGDTLASFRAEWEALSEADKTALKAGIGDGTLSY